MLVLVELVGILEFSSHAKVMLDIARKMKIANVRTFLEEKLAKVLASIFRSWLFLYVYFLNVCV
jgi:hypothetical protein